MGETRMARTRARVTRYLHKSEEESERDERVGRSHTNQHTNILIRTVGSLQHSSLTYLLPIRALHAIEHT